MMLRALSGEQILTSWLKLAKCYRIRADIPLDPTISQSKKIQSHTPHFFTIHIALYMYIHISHNKLYRRGLRAFICI